MDSARRAALSPPDEAQDNGLRRSVPATDAKAALAMFDGFGRMDDR